MKEAIVGLNTNMDDKALVLKNIQVTNAKKNKDGTLYASICKTYLLNVGGSPTSLGSNQVPGVCTWNKNDVTIVWNKLILFNY